MSLSYEEFKERALSTETKIDTLNFGEVGLHALLTACIETANLVDAAKKKIYYGKELNIEEFAGTAYALSQIFAFMADHADALSKPHDRADYEQLPPECADMKAENVNLRLLHGGLGMFGETGEILKALRGQLETGTLDAVNLLEEVGDTDWYKMILHDEAAFSEPDARQRVLNKLELRRKNASITNSELRDLAAERAALEAPAAVQ